MSVPESELLLGVLWDQLEHLYKHAVSCQIPEGCIPCNRFAVVKDLLLVGFNTVDFPSQRSKPNPARSGKPAKSLTRKK